MPLGYKLRPEHVNWCTWRLLYMNETESINITSEQPGELRSAITSRFTLSRPPAVCYWNIRISENFIKKKCSFLSYDGTYKEYESMKYKETFFSNLEVLGSAGICSTNLQLTDKYIKHFSVLRNGRRVIYIACQMFVENYFGHIVLRGQRNWKLIFEGSSLDFKHDSKGKCRKTCSTSKICRQHCLGYVIQDKKYTNLYTTVWGENLAMEADSKFFVPLFIILITIIMIFYFLLCYHRFFKHGYSIEKKETTVYPGGTGGMVKLVKDMTHCFKLILPVKYELILYGETQEMVRKTTELQKGVKTSKKFSHLLKWNEDYSKLDLTTQHRTIQTLENSPYTVRSRKKSERTNVPQNFSRGNTTGS
ncbi:hypothetical protein SNEBB_006700 [Seison nebaliae]|nr:hypothetical protein SNEBB_006700 [Seison nebaliae]